MAVLHPLKLRITNWPVGDDGVPVVEHFELANNPERAEDGTRSVAFSGELWIEREDFQEVPPPKYFRLSPGREVRLRGAYFVTATDVVKDAAGEATGEALDDLNPASREVLTGCRVEAALRDTLPGEVVQFERLGYFAADLDDTTVFHRTVGLKDEWANLQKARTT